MWTYLRSHKLLLFQSIIFLLLSLLVIVGNGDIRCSSVGCGLHIGQWHLHDALWHISLSKLSFNAWPFKHPFMAGELLQGYNYLLDIAIFGLFKVGISPFFAFFKILPIISGLLYVICIIKFVTSQTTNWIKYNLLAFFLYFGSSMSYLATLFTDHNFFYSSMRGFPVVTSIQPAMMFLNLQYSLSLSFILLIYFVISVENPKYRSLVQLFILFFILFGLKFYGGIIALVLFGSIILFKIISHKNVLIRFSQLIAIFLGSFVSYLIFYKTNTPQVPFTWAPFALTHVLIDDPLLFYNHNMTLARYYLYEFGRSFSVRLIAIELYGVVLLLLVNFGARLVGLGYVFIRALKGKLNIEFTIITLVIILSFLMPVLFVQSGGWYNTMQFLYYGVWLSGILTAEAVFWLISRHKVIPVLCGIFVLILTLPNCIEQLRYISAPQMLITTEELDGLEVLKKEPPGIVHINNPFKKNGYVPALAEKFPYYLDTDQLMVTRANYQEREEYLYKYRGGSITMIPADYFYIYKSEEDANDSIRNLTGNGWETIYDSSVIRIVKHAR